MHHCHTMSLDLVFKQGWGCDVSPQVLMLEAWSSVCLCWMDGIFKRWVPARGNELRVIPPLMNGWFPSLLPHSSAAGGPWPGWLEWLNPPAIKIVNQIIKHLYKIPSLGYFGYSNTEWVNTVTKYLTRLHRPWSVTVGALSRGLWSHGWTEALGGRWWDPGAPWRTVLALGAIWVTGSSGTEYFKV